MITILKKKDGTITRKERVAPSKAKMEHQDDKPFNPIRVKGGNKKKEGIIFQLTKKQEDVLCLKIL